MAKEPGNLVPVLPRRMDDKLDRVIDDRVKRRRYLVGPVN